MRIRRLALAGAVLILGLMPRDGQSQGSTPTQVQKQSGRLGQNYPNPFNPETWIPFDVGSDPANCGGDRKLYRVRLRILNVLAQQVSVPQLEGGSGGVAGGQLLDNALLPCGSYTAYWNGKYLNSSREAASGVYVFTLEVDGKVTAVKRSTVAK